MTPEILLNQTAFASFLPDAFAIPKILMTEAEKLAEMAL